MIITIGQLRKTMSKIKKAVLFLLVAVALLLITMPVNASTTIGGGGEFFSGAEDELTLNLDLDHRKDIGDNWQYVFEGDLYYALEDGEAEENTLYTQFKLNKDLSEKSYFLSVLQVDYDEFRDYDIRTVFGAGYGRKLYRSDKWKISNEVSLAYLESDQTEVIIRNSLWIAYMLSDRISITNKALYESSKEMYVRIETELEYKVTDRFSLSIANEHTQDYETENILTFNFEVAL